METSITQFNIVNGNDAEEMEVTEEVPEDVFEDYTQLTEEYSNTNHIYSQANGGYYSQESIFSPQLSSTRSGMVNIFGCRKLFSDIPVIKTYLKIVTIYLIQSIIYKTKINA